MAKYPQAYPAILALDKKSTKTAKFTTVARHVEALRCCTRYRLAASFEGLKLADYVEPKTEQAYGSVFRVFLAFTTFEIMLEAIGMAKSPKAKQLSEEKYEGEKLLTDLELQGSFRPLVKKLSDLHNTSEGEQIRKDLSGYLDGSKKLNIIRLAKAIRNAFSHGRLASAPINTDAKELTTIYDKLAAHILWIVDSELTKFMS